MSDYLRGKAVRKLLKGVQVNRDAATLPQATAGALFNVVGGRVTITQILGEVTTAIENQANATKLVAIPTGGSASDLCDTLDIGNDGVGTMYSITGAVGTAMQDDAGVVPDQTTPLIVKPGTISLDCAASNTGEVKWSIIYVPVDDGAYVEEA